MKRLLSSLLIGLSAMTLLSGCLVFQFGGGKKSSTSNTDQHPVVGKQTITPTLGQQLIDLKRAKDTGAITEAQSEAAKAKLLGKK